MKWILAAPVALCLLATAASAEPMWDVAPYWECRLKLHVKVNLDGTDVAINEEEATITYDFERSKVTSTFSNQEGTIGRKFHVEGSFAEYHYIEDQWGSYGIYPGMIVKTGDEYWKTGASGHTSVDKRLWISNFLCEPGTRPQ